MDTALNWTDAPGLRVVYHYKLANTIPLDGTASYADVSVASCLKESLYRCFIRLAMATNIFDEDPNTKRVRHTPASRRLTTDQGVCDAVGLFLDDRARASSKLINVWDKYGQNSSEPTKCAFSLYSGTEKSIYTTLASQPQRHRRFDGAMHFFTKDDTWDLRPMLAPFDWQSVDKPGDLVIDIGGGNGQIIQYLACHISNTYFTIQDLPHVVSLQP